MAKVKVRANAEAKAEEELKKAMALAEKMGIEITTNDTLESLNAKLAKKGVESTEEEKAVEVPLTGERPSSLPRDARQIKANAEEVKMYQTKGKLVGYDEVKGTAWVIPALLLVFSLLFSSPAMTAEMTDEGVLGNNRWSIQNDGDFVPNANTYSIGSATQHPASMWLGDATPISFDGATADTIYTIFAIDDPTSSSKTITFPAVTGQVMLGSAATILTPGAAVTLTIGDGNQTFTDTITTDNQDQTITFSGAGSAGDRITIIFTTDTGGTGDEVITFETTLTQSAGTLTLANLTAGQYVISFISNGSVWIETSRTAALS